MSGFQIKLFLAKMQGVFKDDQFVCLTEDTPTALQSLGVVFEAGTKVVYCHSEEGYFGTDVWQVLNAKWLGKVGTVVSVSQEGSVEVDYLGTQITYKPKSLRVARVDELSKELDRQNDVVLYYRGKARDEKARSEARSEAQSKTHGGKTKKRKTSSAVSKTMDDDDVRDACWDAAE